MGSTPPQDYVRELILRFLYEKRKRARSLEKIGATVSEIKKELKKHGIKESEVVANLDFLIKNGLVKEIRKRRLLPKQKIEVEAVRFELSDVGLHFFEPPSKFDFTGKFGGLVFENIKDSVIVVGHENIVYHKFSELYPLLEELKFKIIISNIPEDKKLEYLANIETIKAQIVQEKPDKDIISRAWERIKDLSTIGSLATLIEKIYKFIISITA
ncbi:MAG: hypothetical protein DSO07_10335 [Thermoproteota archaeon]|jgi:hypothetical protein|uniref:Uncharacterized protein n=1 Tax=Candidatus Methanodesulfokora washburnensis TaxID=2478471 RepID=A0A429GSM5_9CREN|nr:hypothetical protein [Candidatus Methanodesulfokores washburnensis]RSN76926.1 hypothetical protein D6D85_03340 [Candidatus Methanodesulfokores washburnensis]TDA39543.1 MAG: hypothetical protein DSO07_10335 [Candidatus Korarchaeota archaeon]